MASIASTKLFFKSSVGRKMLLALTGLALSGFVLTHMAGNMLLFFGPDAYNLYSHKLISNPLIYVAEIILVAIFIVHVALALKLAWENKTARHIKPSLGPSNCEKAARFGSQYMVLTGLLILAFVGLHLYTFKYGEYFSTTVDGVEMRDLHRLAVESFKNPLYTGYYLLSMIILFVHLAHGFNATFQSLGMFGVRNCLLKKIGFAFALVIGLGFISQPIYGYFYGGN